MHAHHSRLLSLHCRFSLLTKTNPRCHFPEHIAAQTACEAQRVAEEAMVKECNILEAELENLEEATKTMESDDFFLALRRIENVDAYWRRCGMGMLETMSSLHEARKELARIQI